jgi:3-hydroxypropanoate dehydrogenase
MISDEVLDVLFRNARTHSHWTDEPVSDEMLRAIYDLAKWPPTSANGNPGRFVFVKSKEAKERLKPALSSGNVEKTMTAPVTVIVAYDLLFHTNWERLFPHSPKMYELFVKDPEFALSTAKRNSSLQGAYLILAARALGLDCGPMSGFNNAKVDEEFFKDTSVRSNFLINLGHGDPSKLRPRAARLEFEEACTIL